MATEPDAQVQAGRSTGAHHGPVTETDPLWLTPTVVSPGPLRPPSPDLGATEHARAARGLAPTGLDHPRGRWWSTGVLPAALLDGVAVVVASLTGSVLALVLAVILAVAVVVQIAWIVADPLRLNASARREATRLRVWTSGQPWAARADAPERVLLAGAQQAVQTIVATDWWWGADALPVRFQIDFRTELDEIDAQAYRLAGLAADDPVRSQLRAPLELRVQALTTLADQVRHRTTKPALAEPDVAAIIGGVRDEHGADRIAGITAALRELDR